MQSTLLKNKNYLLYLFGNNTSIFGDILLSPFSGAWVDKLKKRQTVIWLDLIRGVWLAAL